MKRVWLRLARLIIHASPDHLPCSRTWPKIDLGGNAHNRAICIIAESRVIVVVVVNLIVKPTLDHDGEWVRQTRELCRTSFFRHTCVDRMVWDGVDVGMVGLRSLCVGTELGTRVCFLVYVDWLSWRQVRGSCAGIVLDVYNMGWPPIEQIPRMCGFIFPPFLFELWHRQLEPEPTAMRLPRLFRTGSSLLKHRIGPWF